MTSHARALTWRWAPRLAAVAVLLTVNVALPPGRPPGLVDFAYALIAALLVAATIVAMLYVRNRRLIVSDRTLDVFDLFGLRRSLPRAELSELVGLRLLLLPSDSLPGLPVACFRGSRLRLCLAGPLWSAEELEATAERLRLRLENQVRRMTLRVRRRRRLSTSR